ncbi:MAG: hypothetical protein GKR95_13560 [Gammaproteobacteria bacterium]|nr:hypothetical protein [Gammaproteobacteria bacterium]
MMSRPLLQYKNINIRTSPTRIIMKIANLISTTLFAMTLAFSPAQADDWKPSGPLKLQIGFGAGGSTDTMGRVIAKVMKEQTGWNVIAENKTGGGGVAMFTGIARMPAKGNVIGMGVNMPIMINIVKRGRSLVSIWIVLITWVPLRKRSWL